MNITLLNPAALWALTALAIPLVIHLLHRGQRERVMVGSVRFLKGRETQTFTRLRLTEKRLLLLRMLIFALLAALFAQPHWRGTNQPDTPTGWLLIDPRLAGQPLPAKQTRLRQRAVDQNWRVTWLAPGFPHISEAESPPNPPGLGEVWSLTAEAAMALPDDRPLHVLTLNRLEDFQGQRPRIAHSKLGWHQITVAAEVPVLEAGYLIAPDHLILISAIQEAGNWIRSRHGVGWNGQSQWVRLQGLPPLHLELEGAQIACRFEHEAQASLQVANQALPMTVALVAADTKGEDVRLLQLAIKTLAQYYSWPIDLHVSQSNGLPQDAPAVAFWLGLTNVDPPTSWFTAGTWLVRDAGETRYHQRGETIMWDGTYPGKAPNLHRRIGAVNRGRAVWWDVWGQPVLEKEFIENGVQFHFASRFLPQWCDLVFNQAFPLWLADLIEARWLADQPKTQARPTSRFIAAGQAKPRLGAPTTIAANAVMTSLAFPIWLLLMAVFMLERWWCTRRRLQ